jgi:hypothetical protein
VSSLEWLVNDWYQTQAQTRHIGLIDLQQSPWFFAAALNILSRDIEKRCPCGTSFL